MKGLDLHNAMTEIDESFIKEADQILTNSRVCEMTNATQEFGGRKNRRKSFRIALIAACAVVLLAGTVYAATKGFRGKAFLDLIGTEGDEEEISTGFVSVGDARQIGDLVLTLEDIIGDRNTVFVEISTNINIEQPEGWLLPDDPSAADILPVTVLGANGTAVFPDGEKHDHSCGYVAFCREGRLWYFLKISYRDPDVDLSHMPMHLSIDGQDAGGKAFSLSFEWTNDFKAKSEVIPVNKEVDGVLLTDIRFSLSRMDVNFKTEMVLNDPAKWFETLSVDYIRLDDGKTLRYSLFNGMPIQENALIHSSPKGTDGTCYYNLLCGFSEDGVFRLVPYERIQSICINGEEIRIR